MTAHDFISALRDKQLALSRTLSEGLIQVLDAALWFPLAVTEEVDADTARLLVTKELEHQVHKAVLGYTDWAAVVIVRSKRFGERPVPDPDEDDVADICRKYDVKPPILGYVVDRLSRLPEVPLLGTQRRGTLVPDKKALREWSSFFDWRSASETG